MALNDVYQLICRQHLFGRNVENVFFFDGIDGGGSAADLIDGFIASYFPVIRPLQSFSLFWDSIDCYSLGNLADFEKRPHVFQGSAGNGDTMPAFNAVGYTLNPLTRAVRPGSKRFAGVLESVALNGEVTDPTYIAAVEALRVKLDDVIVGALHDYQPVIVKRTKTAVAGTVPQQYTYRLPVAGDPLVLGLVKSATVNMTLTSQVSRKD